MQVTVVGTGYVGVVTAAGLAHLGHVVTGLDRDPAKVAALTAGEVPLYEPGLDELVERGLASGRLRFSGDYAEAVPGADVVFLAVGTPQRSDGTADLSQIASATEALAAVLDQGSVVVVKSTVPVGTTRETGRRLAAATGRAVPVASNPEFLREGSAVADFLQPDRIVVGSDAPAAEALRELYTSQLADGVPALFTGIETAELIKYAANAFLATKLSFINEIADLCEAAGASIDDVARGVGLDHRISDRFLRPGPGFGGSCLPKDLQALLHTGNRLGTPSRVLRAALDVNEHRKRMMVARIADELDGELAGRRIAALGITYKADTDDLRESPAVDIVSLLVGRGARVTVHDPEGLQRAREQVHGVDFADDPYAAAKDADAVVVLTEWPQYRDLDLEKLRRVVAGAVILDLRNLLDPAVVRAAGFRYRGVGRPAT